MSSGHAFDIESDVPLFDEEEPELEEQPKQKPLRKKRKKQDGSQGSQFSEVTREHLGHVYNRAKEVFEHENTKIYWGKSKAPCKSLEHFVEFLTGTSISGARQAGQELKKDGFVHPCKPKGPKPTDVTVGPFADFYEWVCEKIEDVKKGGKVIFP